MYRGRKTFCLARGEGQERLVRGKKAAPNVRGQFPCHSPGPAAPDELNIQVLGSWMYSPSLSNSAPPRVSSMIRLNTPLLNFDSSHATAHYRSLPLYCPVTSCSRSEGGKVFKRKNEMIRDEVVHQSPSYFCPFCPQREHKYHMWLRHVRVHHRDKSKDDPQLRDALTQPAEGLTNKKKRRFWS